MFIKPENNRLHQRIAELEQQNLQLKKSLVSKAGIREGITAIGLPDSIFRKAVESAYDNTVITDLNGWVKYANPAAVRIFGYEPDDLVGQNAAIFYPQEMPQAEWLVQQAIAGGWSGEVVCQRKNGDCFPALVSVGPIYDEMGQLAAVSMISSDITSQKEIQAELVVKNLELERVSRLKSVFLANMSHELRTPLTSILGLSSLLDQQVFGALNHKQLLIMSKFIRVENIC